MSTTLVICNEFDCDCQCQQGHAGHANCVKQADKLAKLDIKRLANLNLELHGRSLTNLNTFSCSAQLHLIFVCCNSTNKQQGILNTLKTIHPASRTSKQTCLVLLCMLVIPPKCQSQDCMCS